MNKIIKLISSMLISMTMLVSLSACQGKDTDRPNIQTPVAETPSVETPENLENKVTDDLGRQVIFQKVPERIASGYYITSSMLIALGVGDKLVGIEAKADNRPLYALVNPNFLALPNVGTAKEFNTEGALKLKPDLLVVPIRLKDVVKTLEELEMKVLGVNPESWTDMERVLRLLGEATGTSKKAEEIISYNNELLTKAGELAKKFEGKAPTIYFGGNSDFLTTAGGKMYQSSLIKQVGASNVAEELGDNYWSEVSYEQVLAWQPDYIVLASDASYTVDDVLNDPALSGLKAVEDKKVYKIPSSIESWDSPVPASVLGVLAISSYLHEEDYKSEELKADVVKYYEKFYGFTFKGDLK